MTRIDSARAAASSAKDSARHAAEAVAPYADTARDTAAHYAHEARLRLAPKVSSAAHQAADQARLQYDAHLAHRLEQARTHVPPRVDHAATRAREAARHAAAATRPRVEQAVAAAQPAASEAAARSAAALAALRGEVSPKEIQRLVKRHERRSRAGWVAKRLVVLGAVGAAAVAAWRWWDKQANPDWLVEPPAATEVSDDARFSSVDGSGQTALDPEVQAKQAEAEASGSSEQDDR
ncbi:DUF5324 family protein [Streptomyces apocyni]|uniref:DUF5324 family protein n=1 Tax=Streptomyces apocyni TaxID=2654677 RepID=UPI0012E9B31F|nr:DUF5324 family protein [Streptomyces apocyni]